MNLFVSTISFVVVATFFLCIVLPGTLITPKPNTGAPVALQFYNEPNPQSWIVPVTAQCRVTPDTDYSQIRSQSNTLFNEYNASNARGLSGLAWGFGQLVMEDIFKLCTDETLPPISITLTPWNDMVMNVSQLKTRCGMGTTQNPWGCCEVSRGTPSNSILDASWLYGNSVGEANALRNNVRGQMRMSTGGNLPLSGGNRFAAGTALVNENTVVASLITLFVREHNYWANELFLNHPAWTDEQLFYKARSYVIAEYQSVVWNEWIPAMLGSSLATFPPLPVLVPGTAQVSTEFALVAAEFHRTLVNGGVTPFTNTTANIVIARDITTLLRDAWYSHSERFDSYVSRTLTNNTATRWDYISEALVHAQSVGTADYVYIRQTYGIPPDHPFGNGATPLSGILGEPVLQGTSLSRTARAIIGEQLSRSIAYDPLFFTHADIRNYLGRTFYHVLTGTKLHTLIYRNTGVVPPASGGVVSVFYKS